MNFFGMGVLELVFILMVALLLLGPNKMLDVARTLGKYVRELQRATTELPRLLSLDDEQSQAPPPQRRQIPEQPPDKQPADEQQDPTPRM